MLGLISSELKKLGSQDWRLAGTLPSPANMKFSRETSEMEEIMLQNAKKKEEEEAKEKSAESEKRGTKRNREEKKPKDRKRER